MASIESLLQEWEKVAPKATDEVAEFVPMYGYVPFCNIKRRNLTTRFAGASPILGEALQRHCEHTDKHQFIYTFTIPPFPPFVNRGNFVRGLILRAVSCIMKVRGTA